MRRWALPVALVLALAGPAAATDWGIFVDGSYSDTRADTEMDRLVDRRLAEADRVMDSRHPGSQRSTVGDKQALREALARIRCGCGDTITVVLMGHGTKDRFVFSKAPGAERRLEAAELAAWLEGAAVECCCTIRVVIFSCHSGSFLDELLAQPHVDSVWTSSATDERSYSEAAYELDGTFRDGGDWMQGFLEDWRDAPRADSLGDALQRSSESAEEKMPDRFTGDQHPVGWRRGELPVLAHVERPPRGGKLELHFFSPEFMRSRTLEIAVEGVELPEGLVASNWVSFRGTFGAPADPPRVAGPVTRAAPPAQPILAHVEGIGRKSGRRYVKVHTVRPKWLYSKKQRLWLDDGVELPADLRVCGWLEGEVRIEDPEATMSTAGPLRHATPTFSAKVHATGTINHQTGVFRAHLLDPSWLRCQRREIQLPEGERGLLRNLRSCDNVLLDLDLGDGEAGRYRGSRAAIVRRDRGEWGPQRDVAVNVPGERRFVVGANDEGEERRVAPAVGVTNVGQEAATKVPVRAVLGPAAAEPALRAWLAAEGTAAPAKEALWSGEAWIPELAPGDTAEAAFDSWLPPEEGGRFWAGFRAALPGDENPASDVRGLAFDVPPAPVAVEPPAAAPPPQQEVSVPPGAQVVELGTLGRGEHRFPITAVNASCRGRHDFRASFEPASGSPGGWFRIMGPETLRRIAVGESKTTDAVIDLRSVPPGPLAGILRVVCVTCPPPPVCIQTETVFLLRLTVPD